MNLKESYRYQNFLNDLLDKAYWYLEDVNFVTSKEQDHLRSKADKDATDEKVIVPKTRDVDFTPNNVINFAVKVLSEKEKLSEAIAVAKASAEINIDNAISLNRKKQDFVCVLNRMAARKPSEKTTKSVGYRFNNEMNQVSYYYDVVEKTSIDFNRNDVRNLAKKYLKETDEISTKLDAIEIITQVDFSPAWDVNSTFDELVIPAV